MQNNSSPVPSAIPEAHQIYTGTASSIQQSGSTCEAFMPSGMLTGGISVQPVLTNGGLAVQPASTVMMAQQQGYTTYPGDPVLPSCTRRRHTRE